MNSAHLHLVTVHIPVIVTWIVLILGLISRWQKSKLLELTAIGFFLGSTAFACIAYFSGGYAFEWLTHSEFEISKPLAEEHAVIARAALIANVVVAVLAFNILLQTVQKETPPRWLTGILWAAIAGLGILYAWTAHQGGEIRHPEIEVFLPTSGPDFAQYSNPIPPLSQSCINT
jgi:uncharacterized protein YacL